MVSGFNVQPVSGYSDVGPLLMEPLPTASDDPIDHANGRVRYDRWHARPAGLPRLRPYHLIGALLPFFLQTCSVSVLQFKDFVDA